MKLKKSHSRKCMAGVLCCTLLPSLALASPEEIEEIRVTVHPLGEQGTAQATEVLTGDALNEAMQGSLGETLARLPGISSASFGSVVGRPVIHGLGGARVKTTQDQIDSLDVSVTSGDHAVAIEPFVADRINVLKGASTLLYGSAAIGGVVDVETGRIATELPEKPFQGRAEARASDNGDTGVLAFRLDGRNENSLAWHLDAYFRDSDEYEIPGMAESAAFRAMESDHDDDDHDHEEVHDDEHGEHDEEEANGTLTGSQFENKGGAFGLSHIGEKATVGFSVSMLDSQYGLIGGHGHEDEHNDEHDEDHEDEHGEDEDHAHEAEEEEGSGLIDLEQTRLDLFAEITDPFKGFSNLRVQFGVNDYQHQEIEPSGEVGTLFENDAWEGRLLATHAPVYGFDGVVGLQLNHREFSAIGEEAFIAPVKTNSQAIFWVGERAFESFDIETGLRVESLKHRPTASQSPDRDFTNFSGSIGSLFRVGSGWQLSTLLDASRRAPSIEELYSDGAHLATQTFEVGDSQLKSESALSLNLTADYQSDFVDFSATVYRMEFSNFIYQAATGAIIEELPEFVYRQQDADFTGIDTKLDIHLGVFGGGDVDVSLLYDQVRGRINATGVRQNLPRIPANRFGVALSWRNAEWDIKLDYLDVQSQNKVADFELATDGYRDVSFYLARTFEVSDNEIKLFLNGRNLSDEEQRNHVSFVKDIAPMPGRRIELGAQWRF